MTALTARVGVQDDGAVGIAATVARRAAAAAGLPGPLADRAAECAGALARALAARQLRGAVYIQPPPLRPGLDIVAVGAGPAPEGSAPWPSGAAPSEEPLACDLRSVRDLADHFLLRSVPGRGTAACAHLSPHAKRAGEPPAGRAAPPPDAGSVLLPAEGETSCGDAWALETSADGGTVTALVADGLGHGPAAAEAADRAVCAFRGSPGLPLPQLIRTIHTALRSTRGAAVGLLRRTADDAVEHCAVGNVRACVVGHDGVRHRFGAQPGVVGWNMPPPTAHRLPDADGGTLLMHSDGVQGGWAGLPPGLTALPAPLLAVVLAHHHRATRDDVTVLAVGPARRRP
ncbi:SpoIIE family protein phosphatase [Streptomyces kanasensis]|uniref:Uncharacterized protein n=1 Tax=Streptomyces kanasensis TaxID=936756 RepID=A0A100Y8J6_9ACTN|nr:SpoIIE family protein phosphatase [Streptomyces kanasensis]KUH39670.1 hypothetical protein ATE80_05940 [Streptomyces kanasensis]